MTAQSRPAPSEPSPSEPSPSGAAPFGAAGFPVPASGPRRVGLVRRVLGILAAVTVMAAAALFGLAVWNPWQLVLLEQHFGNPWAGLAVVAAGTYLATWLLSPVRHEAVQRGRIGVRVFLGVVVVLSLIAAGLLGPQYRYQATELARTADGDRAIALLVEGGLDQRSLVVWEGEGLGTRQVASLGEPCTGVTARFDSANRVIVDQGYGEWSIMLDPATGQPRQVLGARCPDPPVPATLGP